MLNASGLAAAAKRVVRPLVQRSPTLAVAAVVAEGRRARSRDLVRGLYTDEWGSYERWLDRARSLDEWLSIPGIDDVSGAQNVDGRLVWSAFDHRGFIAKTLVDAICREVPDATSFTEYGCGVGRNVLAVKRALPRMAAHGYELTGEGVRVARSAAAKFGVDASFAELDYVSDPSEHYIHPPTDVAFTVYSLHDVPRGASDALAHMFARTNRALVLLEPTPENFPLTYRGLLGRVYARARDYLHDLDAAIAALPAKSVRKQVLATSNNPVLYPTLYVVQK